MSHFATVVILPKDTPFLENHINDALHALLAPYNENLEVPEYEKTCYCVKGNASQVASGHADSTFRTTDSIHQQFREREDVKALEAQRKVIYNEFFVGEDKDVRLQPGKNAKSFWKLVEPIDDANDKLWREGELKLINQWYRIHDAKLAEVLPTAPPDADCDECNGTGKVKSTYNPKSQWDWWSLGGRWAGEMTGFKFPDDGQGGFNFAELYRKQLGNVCYVKHIKPDFVSFAVVTPDGEWHEKGDMGWFGAVSDGKEDWPEIYKQILAQYPEHIACLCDLHI